MYRPTFPHTIDDIIRSISGGLGIVVGDLPDGSIWVLKRNRKTNNFTLKHYESPKRQQQLASQDFADRHEAVMAMARAIGLHQSS